MSDIGFDLNINNGANYKRTLSDIERILDRVDRQADKAGNIFDRFNESLRTAGLGAKIFANGLDKSAEGLQKIYEGIRGITPQFKAFVQALEDGFKSGDLSEVFGKEGQDAAEEFLGELKDTWGIASPSRVMKQYADQLGAGFVQGTRALDLGGEGKRLATSFAQNFATTLITAVKAATVGVVQAVGGTIQAVGDRLKQGAQDLSAEGKALIQTGLNQVLVGGIAGVVQGQLVTKVANFDQILNQVKVFGHLSTEALDDVQDKILDFASRTIFDPTQSVSAFLDLQKAGLDAADALTVLNNAGNLASAQNISLADSSNYVITAMKTFGFDVDDTTRIVDGFSRAADKSSADANALGQGLANVGPIAAQFGLDFEQTLAVLAKFNDAGITGAEAGTQLKSLLVGITRPTKATVEAFNDLGVSLTDAQGKFKPLNQVINELQDAMNGTKTVTVSTTKLTKEQSAELKEAQKAYAAASRQILLYQDGLSKGSLNEKTRGKNLADYQQIQKNASDAIARITQDQGTAAQITKEITRTQEENFRAIQALGGSFGGIGLSVLLSGDEDAIDKFVDSLALVPSAADIAKEQMNTFKGALESLQGSLEALGIKAIRPLLNNFLKPFIDLLTGLVNAATKIPEPILAAVASIAGLVTAFVTLSGVLNILHGALLILISGPLESLGGILSAIGGFILNPLGIVPALGSLIAVLAPLTALVVGALVAFRAFAQIVQAIQTNANGAGDAFNALMATLGQLGAVVGDIINSALSILSSIVEKVGNVLFGITDIDFSNVTNFFNTLNTYAQQALNFLTSVKDTLSFIADTIKGGTGSADQQKALQTQKDALQQISVLQAKAGTVGQTSSKYLVQQGDSLIKIAKDMNTSVDDLIKANGGKRFKLFAGQSINLPVTVEDKQAQDEIANLRTMALNAQDDIQSGATSVIDTFQKVAGTDFFKSLFGDQNLDQIFTQLRGIETQIRTTFTRVSNDIRTFAENLIESIRTFITNSVQFIQSVIDQIANSNFGQAVGAFISSLPTLFGNVLNGVVDILAKIREAIREFFLFKWLEELGVSIKIPDIGGLRDALVKFFNSLGNPLDAVFSGGELIGKIGEFINDIFHAIQIDWFKLGVNVIKLVGNLGELIGQGFQAVGTIGGNLLRGIGDIIKQIFEFLRDAFVSAAKDISQFIADTIQNAIAGAGQFIEGTGIIPFIQKLIDDVRNFDYIGAITSALSNFGTAIVDGVRNALTSAQQFLDNTGITAFITRLIESARNFDFGDALRRLFERFIQALRDGFAFVVAQVGNVAQALEPLLTNIIAAVGPAISAAFTAVGDFLRAGAAQLGALFGQAFDSFFKANPKLKAAFDRIRNIISAFIGAPLAKFIKGVQDFFGSFARIDTKEIGNALTVVGAALGSFVAVLAPIIPLIGGILSGLGDTLPFIGAALSDFIEALSALREGDSAAALASLNSGLSNLGNALTAFPLAIFNTVRDFLVSIGLIDPNAQAVPFTLDGLASALGGLSGVLLSFPIAIANTVRDLLRQLGANDIADALSETLIPALTDIQTGLGGFFDALKGIDIADLGNLLLFAGGLLALANPITALATAVGIFTALGIGDALPQVGEAIKSFVDTISALISGDSVKFLEGLKNTFAALAGALETLTGSAKEKLTDLGLGDFLAQFDRFATNPFTTGVISSLVTSLSAFFVSVGNLVAATPKDLDKLFPGIGAGLDIIVGVLQKVGGFVGNITGISTFFSSLAELAGATKGGEFISNVLSKIGGALKELFSTVGGAIAESGAAKGALGFLSSLQGVLNKIALLGAVVANFEGLKNGIIGFIQNIQGIKFDALLKLAGAIGILVAPLAALAALGVDLGLAFAGGALPKLGTALKDLADGVDKLLKGDFSGALGDLARVLGDLLGAIGEGALSALDRLSEILTGLFGIKTDFKPSEVLRQIGVIVQALASAFSNIFSQLGDQLALTIVTALRGIIPGSEQIINDLTAKLAAGDQARKLGDALTQSLAGAQVDLSAVQITANVDDIAKNIPPELANTYTQGLQQAIDNGDLAAQKILLPIVASPFFPQASKDALSADVFKEVEAAFLAGDADKVQVLIPVAAKLGVDLAGLVGYGSLSADAVKTAILTAIQTGDTETYNLLMPTAVKLKIDKDPEIVGAVSDVTTKASEVIKNEIAAQGGITVDAGSLAVTLTDAAKNIGIDTSQPLSEDSIKRLAGAITGGTGLSDEVSLAIANAFATGGADALSKLDFAGLFATQTGSGELQGAGEFAQLGITVSQGVIDGLNSGFTDKSAEIQAAAKVMADTFKTSANAEFGIQSPSTWAIEAAGFIIQGLVDGLNLSLPLLQAPLQLMVASFDTLRTGAVLVVDALIARVVLMPIQMAPAIIAANLQVRSLADSWKLVAMQAADAEAAIKRAGAASTAAGVPVPGAPPAGPRPPGRANEGGVRKNSWFQFGDGEHPEVYTTADGRQYMLPAKDGYVKHVNQAPVGTTSNEYGGNTNNTSINITVGAGANVNEDQMYNVAKRAVDDSNRENNANRRMTNNGTR